MSKTTRQPPPAIQPLMDKAVALHQAGRRSDAVEIYEKILLQVPNHFDATHLLGVISLQEGRLERAQELIKSALRTNPKHFAAINNLGMVYLRKGELELAYRQFGRVVKMQPHFSDGLTNLGTVLRLLSRPREALIPLRQAHVDDSRSALICNLIGACLMDTGDPHAAVQYFEAATLAEPDAADGWSNLAVALNGIGDLGRARECADKAVAMRPGSSAAVAARAAVEFEDGRFETAIETYREAIALPDPSSQVYCAFANVLFANGQFDEAMSCLRQSMALDTNNVIARWKLAVWEIRSFYNKSAELEASRLAFSESMKELQGWFRDTRGSQAYMAVGSAQAFYVAYHPFNNRELLSGFGKMCSEWMASMPTDAPSVRGAQRKNSRSASASQRNIRIGIASAYIRDHSVWNAIIKGWIQHFDKARFEISIFHLGRANDEATVQARHQVAHFEDGPKTVQNWATTIREAELDVLIYPEIGMDGLTTQLAALRLAPVQAAAWGHAETTGLPTIDLYLSADAFEPADADGNYSERLIRLPNLGVCVEPLMPTILAPDLRSLKLPADEPLLLCPGTPFKYSPIHDHVWVRIARGLQESRKKPGWSRITDHFRTRGNGRLVFFRSSNTPMDELFVRRLRRAFDVEKIDFDARVCVLPYLDRPRFFGLMRQSALLLDTVGFSGFNNALQAIEAGLPVLAREGAFMRGRLASGIMRRMDLTELIADTDDTFIEAAVELAQNDSKRGELRVEIANRRNVLYHDIEAVRALERCLIEAVYRSRGVAAGA